jgi:hypothetical protein
VDDQFVHTSESGADNAEDLLHQLFEGTHANMLMSHVTPVLSGTIY